MKMTDLKLGVELMHSTNTDWMTRTYAQAKVVLVSEQRVETVDYSRKSHAFKLADDTYATLWGVRPAADGNKVLVKVTEGRDAGTVKAVTLASLRGEWADCKAESDDAEAARKVRADALRNAEQRSREQLGAIREQLIELGLITSEGSYAVSRTTNGDIAVRSSVMVELLKLAAKNA